MSAPAASQAWSARASRAAWLLLWAGALACGCTDSEASERLRLNARATWDSAVEVAFERRDQVEEALRERLASLEPRIADLRQEAQRVALQARGQLLRKIDDLESERLRLRERLERLRGQGRATWERLAREAESELDGLRDRLSRLWNEREPQRDPAGSPGAGAAGTGSALPAEREP